MEDLLFGTGLPSLKDHQQVQILVANLGHQQGVDDIVFTTFVNRLSENCVVKIGDSESQFLHVKFITQLDGTSIKFSNLQLYRRVFSVVGVHIWGESSSLDKVGDEYIKVKAKVEEDTFDNRLIMIGGAKEAIPSMVPGREVIQYASLDDMGNLKKDIHELLRNVFVILQSKRLDEPTEGNGLFKCPVLSSEEKYQIGIEKLSKNYKKKCIGRMKKQVADLHILTGLSSKAVDIYNIAIENLKSANDLLWLAAAYEGLAVASYFALNGNMNESLANEEDRKKLLVRNHTLNTFDVGSKEDEGVTKAKEHHRRRSDETSKISKDDEKVKLKGLLKSFGKLTFPSKGQLDIANILEKFQSALENFERFSYSAKIEYQCVMKAASLLLMEGDKIKCEAFLRDHISKYLDDSFVTFTNHEKSLICIDCATLYMRMKFIRKHAFFSRLAVLFKLHVSEESPRTENDYKQVYPLLYNTLTGYGIKLKSPLAPDKKKDKFVSVSGPTLIQIKAIQEVFMSSLRAGLVDASIRHLSFLLQNYYESLEQKTVDSMIEELNKMVRLKDSKHNLNQILHIGYCDILIPGVQWTRFPFVTEVKLKPLEANLSVNVIPSGQVLGGVFIYSPFQNSTSLAAINWCVDCFSTITMTLMNCLNFELSVSNLILLTEGCDFSPIPIRLHLPPHVKGKDYEAVEVDMPGFPRSEGGLKIIGYSCEVLGVLNVVKFTNEAFIKTVRVLPKLPTLQVETTLERQMLNSGRHFEMVTEVNLFSGQTFNHTISITNKDDKIDMKNVRVKINQPKISGGPSLIAIGNENAPASVLKPGQTRDITLSIYGIDPATAPNENIEEFPASAMISKHVPEKQESIDMGSIKSGVSNSINDMETIADLIPYTGRLLKAEIEIVYAADIPNEGNETYERTFSIGIIIKIVPAITVSNWHVLSGESAETRYIVLDVNNLTDYDAELNYLADKQLSVQAKETCRVPLLCECSAEISPFAFSNAAQKPSFHMQREETEKLRRILEKHVLSHLGIRWKIPRLGVNGTVPVGSLLSSVSCLKQLVIPLLTVTLSINGKEYTSEDDIIIHIGDMVSVQVTLLVSTTVSFGFEGTINLVCFHDIQNGREPIFVPESIVPIGPVTIPFKIGDMTNTDAHIKEKTRVAFKKNFHIIFRYEGIFKVRPNISLSKNVTPDKLKKLESGEKDFFISTASFNVLTKNGKN
uniref:Peptidylprolyl isomerase n=1 Tax=Rhabditophanes sp. KR3021 TaxID=114890 RepID=A0AC35TQU1_9BILA